jgi:hypothetical protein
MRFPGFGSTHAGLVKDEQGRRYTLDEYELPETQEQRTLLYRVEADGVRLKVGEECEVSCKNEAVILTILSCAIFSTLRLVLNKIFLCHLPHFKWHRSFFKLLKRERRVSRYVKPVLSPPKNTNHPLSGCDYKWVRDMFVVVLVIVPSGTKETRG